MQDETSSHIETHGFRWLTRMQHLHPEISQSSATSANPNNHSTIHQEARLTSTTKAKSGKLEASRSLLAEAEKGFI